MAMSRARLVRQRAGITASMGSYRAAESPRTRAPYTVLGGSGDVHADNRTRRIVREMTRDLERNSHLFGILQNRWLDDLGAPEPHFRSVDPVWNTRMHARWQAKKVKRRGGWDARQMTDFAGWVRLFAGSVARDGDVGVVKASDGTWPLIESDRIDSPVKANQYQSTVSGLTLDRAGAIQKVWICPVINGYPRVAQAVPYSADDVEFCAHRQRQSQTRGMPPLVAGIDDFERGDSLLESSVIQAEQASGIYGVIKKLRAELGRATGSQAIAPITNGGLPAPINAGASNADQVPDYVSAARGALMMLYEDQEFAQVKNENPNLNVPPFMQFLMRLHSLGLSYPYELAFMDMNGNSWSNGKMLVTLARAGMKRWHQTFNPTLTSLAQGQAKQWHEDEERGELPQGWDNIAWTWPEIPWPDPLKEEQTNKLARENGTTSTRRILPEWREVLVEIAEEDTQRDALQVARVTKTQELCNAANAKVPGLDLNWRQVVSMVGATSQPAQFLQSSELANNSDKPVDPKKKEPAE